jgi:hypothetical protein
VSAQLKNSFATPVELYRVLTDTWSAQTASPSTGWTSDVPAMNHCSVTSLIVQDYFGGDIVSTKTKGGTHFYNLIDGTKWDLTVSQFAEPIPFDDLVTTRETAMQDTTHEKYEALAESVRAYEK